MLGNEVEGIDPQGLSFLDIDTREDYERAKVLRSYYFAGTEPTYAQLAKILEISEDDVDNALRDARARFRSAVHSAG